MSDYHILIVDDEPTITSALNYYFVQAGYKTILAHTGHEALEKIALNPDLVVLDIMLPDIDGYQICQHIREQPHYTPILMLTAKDTLQEKVIGLDLGADAYLTKPYNPQELLAQVRALLRLVKQQERAKLVCGPIELLTDDKIVRRNGDEIALTATEFELLFLLMQRQGQVFGRETLLRAIWGNEGCNTNTRTIDVHMQRLRAKIEADPKNPELLITIRGWLSSCLSRWVIIIAMLVIDLKLALFLFLLLLFSLFWLVWIIARRRALFDDKQYTVWQSFPLGIVLLSSSGNLRFANRNAHRLLQVEQDMTATAVYAQLLQKIKRDTVVQQFPLSPSPESTLDIWIGRFSAFNLVVLRDVSEQRQREMEMHLYWSSVSHELRTPLTSVLSHLEVSRSENVPEEVQKHSLEIVHQQTHRLNNLINSTLDLGRLKAVTQMPKLSVDIILVAEEAIAELILLAEMGGIGLNFHFDPPIPPALGNPDKLKQLFINLLDNAIKYCQSGDMVTVSLTAVNNNVQCQIADTGAGIPAEHLPRLTQQFYRANRDVPGSGLGLAIVKEIVRQHDGNLFIESNTEGNQTGTTITFTLPMLPELTK